MRLFRFALLLVPALTWMVLPAADPPGALPPLTNSKPLRPAEEQKTFAVPPGFRVELVASEPHVVDPVAMTFDEHGRLFVCEMRGYPNEGRGTGKITSGRIRLLEDKDGDGVYESSKLWAEGLRFPTGITPWKGGLLVSNAPDLLYLKDSKGTGQADSQRLLYTGFDVTNIQQLLNSLQFAMDNWIHGCAGNAGGTIRSLEKPDTPPVALRGRGIRFRPDIPGSLQPTSGGGQYGLTCDDWGRWFTATNSQHLRHIILPDHYLQRNPLLAVRAVTLDIPEHGAACQVFRKSPFEAWRVERTTRRAGGADAKRFPTTELVPGGFVTSGCSPLVYTADKFPPGYRDSVFVCDPANNLILRDVLTPHGATFIARRGHADCEFLTSTDNWFRPVHLTLGPDGAIYVLDFYREVIETPLSLPDDIKARVNLQSRGRGRIWRITTAPVGTRMPRLKLAEETPAELVAHLADENSWWRLTAQRLLIEKQAREAIPALLKLASESRSAVGRAHALWTLNGLNALEPALIERALTDKEAGVREQALQLAEPYLKDKTTLRSAALALVEDPSPRVRFQLAFTLGVCDTPDAGAALAKLAMRPDNDTWTQTAILTSASGNAVVLLEALARQSATTSSQRSMVTRLAALVGGSSREPDLARALALLGKVESEPTPLQIAILDGLGQGLATSSRPLASLWEKPSPGLTEAVKKAKVLFEKAAQLAEDEKQAPAKRAEAVQLLGRGPFAPLGRIAAGLLSPQSAPEIQLAAVRALSAHPRKEVSQLLVDAWSSASPTLRREMTEALFARRDRLQALVAAMEKKQILGMQIEPVRLAQLRKHPDANLRARAVKVLAGQQAPERGKVVESYRSVLDVKGDPERGKKVFQKNCATCHRLENVGTQVGADLLAALRNKSAESLLIDILDPSREVDPRYLAYQVTTSKGQVLSGLIAAETASSITLKRGEGAEDTVLRTQIDSIESTGKSLMPEGLEVQISRAEMADLIAYLLKIGSGK